MSDENRPPIGWNTDDDNINFDISLDQNTAPEEDNLNLFDDPKPKSDFEPNFDININPDEKPTQLNKETNSPAISDSQETSLDTNPIQQDITTNTDNMQDINTQIPEDHTEISNPQETSLDTNPIQQEITTNTDNIQDINTQSQIQESNQQTQVINDQLILDNDNQNIKINWDWDNLSQTDKDYSPDLKSVDDTVQQLQEAKEQWIKSISSEELSQIPTINNPNVQINNPQDIQTDQTDQADQTNQDNVWINLDEILPTAQAQIEPQSPEETIQTPTPQNTSPQEVVKVQFPESIQKSIDPYDLTKNKNTNDTKNKEHKKHLLMMVGIGSVCLLVGFFILKTMYPVQFGSNDWDTQYVEISQEETQTQEESNPFQQETLDNTGNIVEEIVDADIDQSITNTGKDTQQTTGDSIQDIIQNDIETIQEQTWDTQQQTWIIQEQTWDTQQHNITDTTDPFEMLDKLQTDEEIKKQATLESLKDFQQKWLYYLDLEKQIRSSSMRKYWLYLEKKSEEFINQIENWEILDISSLDTDLAQLSQFLQKLQDLENESSQNIQQTGDQQPEIQQ